VNLLAAEKLKSVLQSLETKTGTVFLAEPEAVVAGGQKIQGSFLVERVSTC
jgi:hypothetical protein